MKPEKGKNHANRLRLNLRACQPNTKCLVKDTLGETSLLALQLTDGEFVCSEETRLGCVLLSEQLEGSSSATRTNRQKPSGSIRVQQTDSFIRSYATLVCASHENAHI